MDNFLITNNAWDLLKKSETKLEILSKALSINIEMPMFPMEAGTKYAGIIVCHYETGFVEELKAVDKEIIFLHPMLELVPDEWWTEYNIKSRQVASSI